MTEGDQRSDETWARAREASQQMILQAAMEDVESKASKLEDELRASMQKNEQQGEKLTNMRTLMDQLDASLETKSTKLQSLQSDYQSKVSACERLEESERDKQERLDRSQREADALREEISRLTKVNTECKEKLMEIETQAKLGDSEVVPLRYQVQRVTAEMDSVTSHAAWLEAELKSKNEQVANLRTTHASEVARLRTEFDTTVMEKDELDAEATTLRRQLQGVQNKLERSSRELRDSRKEASDKALEMDQELVASHRLVTLQKEQMERLQERHESMSRQMEAMKKLAKEAEDEGNAELQAKEKEWEGKVKEILQEQSEDYKRQLADLSGKLEDANRRCKKAEDGLLLTDASSRRMLPTQPLALTNSTGADDEPLNLTDLYGRVAEAEDALAVETLRRKKAEIRVARIEADIQAKAPELIRQRRQYEMAMERQEEYKNRLEAALEESQEARSRFSELQREMGQLRKRNKELEDDASELAKQVQVLLVSRSTSATGITAGSQVPASVVEMQSTNQRLLAEHRRLTATVADLEAKLQQDAWRNKAESYERDLETLREDRKRQEVLVEGIVQQRDLYRALVNKQDSNLLGSQSDEVSALQVVKTQAERTKALEQEKKRLESELAVARAELGTVGRDSEAASERLARYEALNAELSKTIDMLQLKFSAAKAEVARTAADAAFHKEKTVRLDETLQRSTEEAARIAASKSDLQRINQGLQESVSKANAEAGKLEGELGQAKMRLRLAETQAETAKKAEERATSESMHLRNELSRQGALNETIQRIQTSLSTKNAVDEESAKDRIASLTKKLSDQEEKNTVETEKLNGLVSDHTLRMQLLETEKVKAVRECLDAKRAHLKSTTELQESKKKQQDLESELVAAKKRLGDSEGGNDPEVDLRSKVSSLTAELGAAREETETLKKRVSSYSKLAKNNENTVVELTEALKAAEVSRTEEAETLKSQLELAHSEVAKTKEVIADLTKDLAAQREEREKAVEAVNAKLIEKESEVAEYKKDYEAAQSRHSQLASEVTVLRADASNSQNNYERELALHATARTGLRAAKEEIEAHSRSMKLADEQAGSLQSELVEQRSMFAQEKAGLEKNLKDCEKNLEETRSQNSLLHGQLEKIGAQIEKIQGGSAVEEGDPEVAASSERRDMQKTITELREVVKYVRSEKEVIQAQLDSARRSADRERATAAIAKRSLDEVRSELRSAQEDSNSSGGADVDSLKAKLKGAEEQCRLLGESNSHLREEVKTLETKLSMAKKELESAQKAAQPAEKRQHELEGEKAGLLAEKESLIREIDDWKGRVQSLVTKFNQIDPVEHDKVLKRAEKLEKDLNALEMQKVAAEADSKRIRQLAGRASKELQQNKKLVEKHMKTIEQLTAEKDSLAKLNKAATSMKEIGELQVKLTKLESERANEKIQLTGANEMNDKLRERLRQYQKTINEGKKKENLLKSQLSEAKKKLNDIDMKTDKPSPEPSPETEAKPIGQLPDSSAGKTKPISKEMLKEGSEDSSTVAEKKQAKALPSIPAGGFKFGPSADAERLVSPPPEKILVSKVDESKTPQVSKKRPIEAIAEENASKKSTTLDAVKGNVVEAIKGTGEVAAGGEKVADSKGEAPKPIPVTRRPSGENKELSMKEKLLEKKRKLMMDMKRKQDKLKKSQEVKQDEEKVAADEPSAKRTKVEDGDEHATDDVLIANAAPVTSAVEVPGDVSDSMPTQPIIHTSDKGESEDGKMEEAKSEDASETPKEDSTAVTGTSEREPAIAKSSLSATAPSFFGSGAAKPFLFGRPSGLGGATTFGSSTAPAMFGSNAEASSASSAAFGGAFLNNMKPPGTSTTAPKFTFGSSSSITLPTPSTSQQSNVFNAFSASAQLNSGGVSAKPLFGSKKKEEEPKKDDDEEEGEMEGTE